jgi:hypothetical protein
MIDENFEIFRRQLAALIEGVETFEVQIDQGADKIHAMTAPGVLFVVAPDERIIGQRLTGGGGAFGTPMPKPLMHRAVSFEVHIWGETRSQVDALIAHVANAIHGTAWGSYELKGGTWMGEDGSVNNYGSYYILRGELIVPVVRPAQSVVIGTEEAPLSFPIAGELVDA